MVRKAVAEGRPYPLAFVDVRMPPGWDGIETTRRIWERFPFTEIVICTAYSDYSPEQMRFLNFGRVVDTTVLRTEFGYTPHYTTPEALESFIAGGRRLPRLTLAGVGAGTRWLQARAALGAGA